MAKKNAPKPTHASFAEEHGIKLAAKPAKSNPNAPGFDADHWLVTLRLEKRKFEVFYSKGLGHQGEPPTLGEVLCCLALDANTIESTGSFAEWCSEFGYNDEDADRSKKVYASCTKQTAKLKKFLGDATYAGLLACDEGE